MTHLAEISDPSQMPSALAASMGSLVSMAISPSQASQAPFVHALAHELPQLPQVPGVPRSLSQPLVALPSQSAKPWSQAMLQVPWLHMGVECGPDGQSRPQPPQLAALVMSVSHTPSWSQSARPAVQGGNAAS